MTRTMPLCGDSDVEARSEFPATARLEQADDPDVIAEMSMLASGSPNLGSLASGSLSRPPTIAVPVPDFQAGANRNSAAEANDAGKDLIRLGRRREAAAHFERAIRFDPHFAEAHNNHAIMLKEAGRHDDAIAGYRLAIALDPNYAEAYVNFGHALRLQGNPSAALDLYGKALAIRPGLAVACLGIGQAQLDRADFPAAAAAFIDATVLQPKNAIAYNNLATALRHAGQRAAALEALDQAITIRPDYALAHYNRGMLLSEMREFEAALVSLKTAVSLRPDTPGHLAALVHLLRDLGRIPDAIAIARQVVQAHPRFTQAQGELAGLLLDSGRVDEAYALCSAALALEPDSPDLHNKLGNILRDQGKVEAAIHSYRRALELKPDDAGVRSNLCFTLNFAPGYGPAQIYEENRRWAELHEKPLLAEVRPPFNDRAPGRRLKIGYVCPYFRLHSAASFLLPVLSHHDRARVEIVCYSGTRRPDDVTRRFQALGHVWRETAGLTDHELAALIRTDEIDILIDVALHMQDARLLTFARKPAPVQVTWLGYPGTAGLTSIDYRLSDPYLDPDDTDEAFYSERTVRLPRTFWCYAPLIETPGVNPLPALAAGHITFGCFNNFHKVSPGTLDLWAKVMRQVPASRLILLAPPGGHRDRVRETFEQAGVAGSRIDFVPRLPLTAYFELYQQVDLCLDTIPYPGHTTTLDALWMGVPVVTLAGETAVSRGGVSLLSNLGLGRFIARNADDYVAIVKAAVRDPGGLAGLRAALRDRLKASPLMDASAFTRDMEATLLECGRLCFAFPP